MQVLTMDVETIYVFASLVKVHGTLATGVFLTKVDKKFSSITGKPTSEFRI